MRFALIVTTAITIAITVAACKKGGGESNTPTGPTATSPTVDSTCPPSSSPQTNCGAVNSLGVTMQMIGTDLSAGPPGVPGPFNVTIAGITLTGTGSQYVRIIGLSPGVIEVSGQLATHNTNVNVLTNPANVPGGPVRGSIENVEGPVQNVSGCGIQYFRPTSTSVMPFRFRFRLTDANQPQNDPTACRGN